MRFCFSFRPLLLLQLILLLIATAFISLPSCVNNMLVVHTFFLPPLPSFLITSVVVVGEKEEKNNNIREREGNEDTVVPFIPLLIY